MLNTSAFRSTDGGKTLTNVGGGTHGDHHDLWIDPDNSEHLVIANDGGGAVSAAAGKAGRRRIFRRRSTTTWPPRSTSRSTSAARSRTAARCACRATPGRRLDAAAGAARPPALYGAGGVEPGYIAPDPKDPDVFFAGGNNGSFLTRLNRRTGELREVNPYPRMFSGEPASALVERWQWTYPIIFSPVDPKVLYTSSQHVWRTTTDGQTWDRISGDLTRHDPKTMGDSGGPITHDMNAPEVYATVFALAPGKTDVNILWAGSDDGLVHVTRDAGKTWTNVTPKEMPEFGRVSRSTRRRSMPAPPTSRSRSRCSTIWRRTSSARATSAETWTKIVTGIRADDYVHAVREDRDRAACSTPARSTASTSRTTKAIAGSRCRSTCPTCQVSDVWVEANEIAIATHGRSFYMLDNIAPLRQSGPGGDVGAGLPSLRAR